MKEIKLTIDGKEVQLTEEQLRMLGIEPEKKRNNPFERVRKGERYFYTDANRVYNVQEDNDSFDDDRFESVDYFNDKTFVNQVVLHQLLYRKLLKFSYDNECDGTAEWNGRNDHWCIYYDLDDLKYCVVGFNSHKFDGVWFSSEDAAERAIKEVVEPFMKEHPEFVW